MLNIDELFSKIDKVQEGQEMLCSCTECYWNWYHPGTNNSKMCVSESLADFKMTPNSTKCKGYWSYTDACGQPKEQN